MVTAAISNSILGHFADNSILPLLMEQVASGIVIGIFPIITNILFTSDELISNAE